MNLFYIIYNLNSQRGAIVAVIEITGKNIGGLNVDGVGSCSIKSMDITSEHRSNFKALVVDELIKLCRERGFEWLPQLGQLRKTTYRGFSNILLSFSNYSDGVVVEGHCGVLIDAVEDTVYRYTNGFREFQSNSHTLITSTGRLEGGRSRRRLVSSQRDAMDTAREIFATVDQRGEAFWQRH